jgi:hypothetical protein
MAKRQGSSTNLEQAVVDFAEDLGRMLGTARAKAEGWLGQRNTVAEQLTQIRDTASGLLDQLTGRGSETNGAGRRGRPRKQANATSTTTATDAPRRKRRTMSAKARKAISLAQKRRWATLRKEQG